MQGTQKSNSSGWFATVPFGVWLLMFALLGGVIGLGGFTFSYAEGLSYFSDDPKACANCHVMRDVYDGWNRSPHHAVASCNDCHVPHNSLFSKYVVKAMNGFNHSKAFTLNEIPDTIRITLFNRQITSQNCLHCHGDLVSEITHADKQDPADCLVCHQGVGHGR